MWDANVRAQTDHGRQAERNLYAVDLQTVARFDDLCLTEEYENESAPGAAHRQRFEVLIQKQNVAIEHAKPFRCWVILHGGIIRIPNG
jgi:hypothetical protein